MSAKGLADILDLRRSRVRAHGVEDHVFCPELFADKGTRVLGAASVRLFGAPRKQSPHSPQVIFVRIIDELSPSLDGPRF